MNRPRFPRQWYSDYGMLGVLLLLCLFFSWATLQEQQPQGREAAVRAVRRLSRRLPRGSEVLVLARPSPKGREFAAAARQELEKHRFRVAAVVVGEPPQARKRLASLGDSLQVAAVLTTQDYRFSVQMWQAQLAPIAAARVVTAASYRWPTFLLRENLINVVNQIVVIAIIAIGMTMVIITAGIDLSVGSLIALSAVAATALIARYGGAQASVLVMVLASLGAILLCGVIGWFNGVMVTLFRIPPFIATLGWMLVASGLAYILAGGQSIYDVPQSYIWLGRGADLFGIPNAVVLMIILYAAAYLLMSRTALGRYIYAVGGNPEAARLSGVRVHRVLWFVYTVSGLMAGLGGVVQASQLKSGAPTYGLLYELYVIAAVVVGGTSLAGGEGKIMGTLIGALIIGVIQNGMNLTGVESYTQKVVLGLVILGAVLLDRFRRK